MRRYFAQQNSVSSLPRQIFWIKNLTFKHHIWIKLQPFINFKKTWDYNPKLLLTLDDDPAVDFNGIKQINVLEWLLI